MREAWTRAPSFTVEIDNRIRVGLEEGCACVVGDGGEAQCAIIDPDGPDLGTVGSKGGTIQVRQLVVRPVDDVELIHRLSNKDWNSEARLVLPIVDIGGDGHVLCLILQQDIQDSVKIEIGCNNTLDRG